MPRPRNSNNEGTRRRTEIWREGRHRRGRPESSSIDRAIAASVAAFFSLGFDDAGRSVDIGMIVDGAERILLGKGYDRFEVRGELERRLTRRPDIELFLQICGGPADIPGQGIFTARNFY